MKKYLLLFSAIILFAGISAWMGTDVEKEKNAIQAVIEEETNAFLAKDFDRLAANYVQDETNNRLSASKSAFSFNAGWKDVSTMFKNYMANGTIEVDNKYVKTNYRIKVYKESAWAINDELFTNTKTGESSKLIGVRFLEKVNGKWKIVFLSVVNTSSYDTPVKEEK
jgi:hypothetical protein